MEYIFYIFNLGIFTFYDENIIMTNLNQCIILGGGKSLEEGINNGLFQKIENKFVIGVNFAFKFFNPTFTLFSDPISFYRTYYNEIKDLPLIVGRTVPDLQVKPYSNTIFLKPSIHYTRDLNCGLYHPFLSGIGALSLAIYLLDIGKIYLCYDKKTQVFTNNGWKYFKDLIGNELILTRKYNGETEWVKIKAKQKYFYDGKMYKIKNKGIDLVVTPEHKFGLLSNCLYTSKYNNTSHKPNSYIWQTIPEMTSTNYYIPKTFIWKGKKQKYFKLLGYTKINYRNKKQSISCNSKKDLKILMDNWLKFLGLYISEGCCSYNSKKRNYKIIIYQNHTKKKDFYIENILKNLPFHYKKTKRGWNILNKQLYLYLKQFGKSYQKFIPKKIKKLPPKQLTILLESLMFGDGCTNKNANYYFTASKQLANDVQEIAYKCGYYAEIYRRKGRECKISSNPKIGRIQYTIYFNNSKKQGNINNISTRFLIYKKKIKKIKYKNYVYDITVKNHMIWVKRNNICCWSGNCGFDGGKISDDKEIVDIKQVKNKGVLIKKGKSYTRHISHWYQGKLEHRGIGKISFYHDSNKVNKLFEVFKGENKCNIYNVGLKSNLTIFPKISYDKMMSQIDTTIYDQNELREMIKSKLTTIPKGVK
jgi:hypothetical protein